MDSIRWNQLGSIGVRNTSQKVEFNTRVLFQTEDVILSSTTASLQ